MCEQTCAERFEPVDPMCEDKVRPGCVCAEHMYRDENGDCVTMDECNRCYVDGEIKEVCTRMTLQTNSCKLKAHADENLTLFQDDKILDLSRLKVVADDK